MGAELFHTDRRTDITKFIVAFCNFVNVPKKVYTLPPTNPWINHVIVEVLHRLSFFFFPRNLQKCIAFTKQITKESAFKCNYFYLEGFGFYTYLLKISPN